MISAESTRGPPSTGPVQRKRALATNALTDAMTMAERALMFAEDKPAGFLRASYWDEGWSRVDPRASDRESAIFAMEDNVYDEASAVRARGARARYDDARGSGRASVSAWPRRAIKPRRSDCRTKKPAAPPYSLRASLSPGGLRGRSGDQAAAQAREQQSTSAAAVDAYQTQAIVRQTQGALAAALEARRNAAHAARSAGLKEREAMLMTNLGFALTTIGARQEARTTLETGLALADAIGSLGAVRHAQMNLLGWAATFGNDKQLEATLAEGARGRRRRRERRLGCA